LSRSAKAHYKNITELLNRGGILRETDNYWITLCADMIAKAADASRRLDTEGQVLENDKGILYPHPAGVIYFRAAEIAMKCLSRCGMNPADRGKIIGDEIKRETNPFAELEAEFGSGKGSNTTTTNDADCEGLAIRK
jgi:P27 family predicted phage terminase small subunit